MRLKSRLKGKRRLAVIGASLTLGALSLVAIASASEVVTSEVTATTNDVTVTQGSSTSSTINVTATGPTACAITSANPSTATVDTSYALSSSGTVTTGTPSAAMSFYSDGVSVGGPNCGTTWSGAPTPNSVTGSFSAAATTPVGNYNVTLVTAETNPSGMGAKLSDATPTTVTVHVVAPTVTDTTPPVITPNVSGTLGNNGWYTSDVTVTWAVSDPESSISSSSGCGPTTINTDTSGQTLTCTATSAGGTSSQSVTIKRDATPPTISGSRSPDANTFGWNNGDVAVSFTCGDNLSGVATCGPDTTLSSEGAGQSATGNVTDNAGNTGASATVSDINIDLTAPTVGVTGFTDGQVFTLGVDTLPTPGCNTSDDLSGVQTEATMSSSGGPVGAITVTCSGGKDKADNPQSGTVSAKYYVHYNWSGFFAPIDNPVTGKMNGVKAGSSVPVKFSLGGNQGLLIMALGSPASKQITCDTSDELSTDTPTTTAGSSSLSYDPVSQVYTYVWKTDKAWAGKCLRLTVTLTDGTVHYVDFKAMK